MEEFKLNLFKAYYLARKNKRNTYNQLKFEINYETELLKLYNELINGTYEIGKSIAFLVNKPVKREIFAASFRDRVVHHLVYLYINPILDRQLIEDCYSCRKSKGTHYGIKKAEQYLKEASLNFTKDAYVLKLDIQGFFMAIDKNILIEKLEKTFIYADFLSDTIKKEGDISYEMLWELIKKIVFNDPTGNCFIKSDRKDWEGLPKDKSLFESRYECGLPIGNLTSQLFSNVYLNDFDHYIKSCLRIEYYGRYVDDFYFMHSSKDYLKEVRTICEDYLQQNYRLKIHPKKIYLQHYTKGFSFLGTYIKPNRTYIGRRTKNTFKKKIFGFKMMLSQNNIAQKDLLMMRDTMNSYLGLMKHCNSFRLRSRTLASEHPNSFYRYGFFSENLDKFTLFAHKIN